MNSRRKFLKTSAGIAAAGLLPSLEFVPAIAIAQTDGQKPKPRLRFALASDGHYGQPGTDYHSSHANIVKWLNAEHRKNHLDFVIINGDLVHDRPDLLPEVKKEYFDKLSVPFYAIPGNHDHADTMTWHSVFGYNDNYSFESGDCAFVLANTSNVKGEYICPDNNFLKAELDKYRAKKIVFAVLHIPPHLWYPEQQYFAECNETIGLLHNYPNLKAVFHGHDHSLDAVLYTDKLPHFFDAHFGGNWGTDYLGYRVVEVDEQYGVSTFQVNASGSPVINTTKL